MNGLCLQYCCHSYSTVVVTSLTDKRVTKQLCRVSPALPLCSKQQTAHTNQSLAICSPWPIESSCPHAIPAPSAIPNTKPQPPFRATKGPLRLCLPIHHISVQSIQVGASCCSALPVTDSKTKEIQKMQFQAGQKKKKNQLSNHSEKQRRGGRNCQDFQDCQNNHAEKGGISWQRQCTPLTRQSSSHH